MKIIKLTQRDNGKKLYINPKTIVVVYNSDGGVVHTVDGDYDFVKESAEQIVGMIDHTQTNGVPTTNDHTIADEPKVGDMMEVILNDGRTVKFALTEIGDDYYRYDSRDCIGESVWNKYDSNEGGYIKSDLHKYVDGLWALLPADLKLQIIHTTRRYKDKDGNVGEYTAKLFLPSAAEVFDEEHCYGDEGLYSQMDYYKNRRNRIRMESADPNESAWYWLASVYGGASTNACGVYYHGLAYGYDCSNFLGVPLCFRVKKGV